AKPFQKGKFSYVESTFRYPCNDELYNSSVLKIEPGDLPESIKDEFESTFTSGMNDGKYILNSETDFTDKPIRHFKYPDNKISPFMYDGTTEKLKYDQDSY